MVRSLDDVRGLLRNAVQRALQMRADLQRQHGRIHDAQVYSVVHCQIAVHYTCKHQRRYISFISTTLENAMDILTAQIAPHHRGSPNRVGDGREPRTRLPDPRRPRRVRAAIAVIGHDAEAGDRLARRQRAQRRVREDAAREARAGDLHGEVVRDGEVVDGDGGELERVCALFDKY